MIELVLFKIWRQPHFSRLPKTFLFGVEHFPLIHGVPPLWNTKTPFKGCHNLSVNWCLCQRVLKPGKTLKLLPFHTPISRHPTNLEIFQYTHFYKLQILLTSSVCLSLSPFIWSKAYWSLSSQVVWWKDVDWPHQLQNSVKRWFSLTRSQKRERKWNQ